jgi:hypothetical protein
LGVGCAGCGLTSMNAVYERWVTVRSPPGRNGFELPGSGVSSTSLKASIGRAAESYTFQLM